MKMLKACLADVPLIAECAREFCAKLGHELDEEHYIRFWMNQIQIGGGVIFLLYHDELVVGGIGGIVNRDPLSGKKVAVELFWYVKEQFRSGLWPIRLLSEFERWCGDSGCESVSMIHMEKSIPEHMKLIYAKRGYELIETVHTKRIVM